MSKEAKVFAKHILDSIESIHVFSGNLSKQELEKDRLRQSAIIRELEVIGEAVKNMPESAKKNAKNIPWKQIAGMRDKLIHHYFGIDIDTIWKTIQDDLPILREEIEKIIKSS